MEKDKVAASFPAGAFPEGPGGRGRPGPAGEWGWVLATWLLGMGSVCPLVPAMCVGCVCISPLMPGFMRVTTVCKGFVPLGVNQVPSVYWPWGRGSVEMGACYGRGMLAVCAGCVLILHTDWVWACV